MFDVRCSLVSFLIYLAAFRTSGWTDPPAAERLNTETWF
jgi:hypothetical protein